MRLKDIDKTFTEGFDGYMWRDPDAGEKVEDGVIKSDDKAQAPRDPKTRRRKRRPRKSSGTHD
jgi:hypothetical protein